MYQPPICARTGGNDGGCIRLVPPSKNPGVTRKYCSTRCRKRHNEHIAYQREVGTGGGVAVHDGIAWFQRIMARTANAARKRLTEHQDNCPFAKIGTTCPGRWDVYNRERKCLMRAVLDEDWAQLLAAEDSRGYVRELTTKDGHWKADVPKDYEADLSLAELGAKRRTMTEEQKQAIIRAGGARA
jgi:hypothetical protein